MLHTKPGLLFEVLDSMQDMLRVLDLKQRVVLTNKSYRERFGEQCGKNCTEMFSRAQACSNCVVRRALKTGVSQQKKTSYRGRVYWVKASPLFGADGSALG
ncbi:MAG TPA: PAS domain-containing protein, partial [Clostridia bacterium]|nr:PAS domain-containing protein [Clostridia bacterium]